MWTSNWFKLAGCSQAGSKHQVAGEPCQDSHFLMRDGNSFVMVACDGAGTRSRSGTGARMVARQVGELLLWNATDIMTRTIGGKAILGSARDAVRLAVTEFGGAFDDYACTLVGVLVHEGEIMVCHLGDGAVFVLEGEFPRLLSPPQREGRGTYFVTTEGVQLRMWKRKLEHYMTGFLVTTDGAQSLVNGVTGEVSGLVARLLNTLDLGAEAETQAYLREVCRSTIGARTDDDITLVAARRAFAAGRYGCPECHWPDVRIGWSRTGGAYFGKCRKCSHQLLFTEDEEVIRVYECLLEGGGSGHGGERSAFGQVAGGTESAEEQSGRLPRTAEGAGRADGAQSCAGGDL